MTLTQMSDFLEFLNTGDIVSATPAFKGKIVPVRKNIVLGGRGGAFYLNEKGKKVYLKRYQKRQCVKGHGVQGDDAGVCRTVNVHTQDMSTAVLSRMGGLPKYAKLFIDPRKT